MKKPLLLTFDVEEFDWPVERGRSLSLTMQLRVTRAGLRRVLPVLARHGARCTFFVTGQFAQACPDAVQAVVAAGHEVAVHGFAHDDDYGAMDRQVAAERLRAARYIVSGVSQQPATGVRTPHLLPCPPSVLRAAGFEYDASPHPTWVPGRYNGLRWPRSPWVEEEIARVPISVLPWIRVPVSWIWYRSMGPTVGRLALRLASARAPYLHLYFHPWEAISIRRLGIPMWLALGTGMKFIHALDCLLEWAAPRLSAIPVAEFVGRYRQ